MITLHGMPHSIGRAIRPISFQNPSAYRTVRIAANVSMPLQVQASIGVGEAGDPLGSELALEGAIVLPGVSAVLTFARKSPKENRDAETFAREVVLIPPGEWFVAASSSPPLQ